MLYRSRMRTEAQIQASRLNGAKSRGPVTPAGKRNSARYSTRNGLLARSLSLQTEDPAQLRKLLDDHCAEFQPGTISEQLLVESMVIALWRQLRVRVADKVTVDLQTNVEGENPPAYEHSGAAVTAAAFRSLADNSRSLGMLNLQEIRFDRQYHRALRTLLQLQDRRGFRPSPITPAAPSAAPAPDPVEELEPEPTAPEPTTAPMDLIGMLPTGNLLKNRGQATFPPLVRKNEPDPFFQPHTETFQPQAETSTLTEPVTAAPKNSFHTLEPNNPLKTHDDARVQPPEPNPSTPAIATAAGTVSAFTGPQPPFVHMTEPPFGVTR
jgi:hypothetical protein